MFAKILFGFFGFLVFVFLFWRRLKEDYADEVVFSSAFLILGSALLLNLVSQKFFPGWWFWASTLGAVVGFLGAVIRFKLMVFETIEALVISGLSWLSLVFLQDSISSSSAPSLGGFLATFFLVGLFFFLDAHYKKFSWYKSGKVGFSGMTTLGIFFLVRAVVASTFPFMISFVGRLDAIISGVLAFLAFLTVFNLSRQKL